MTAEPTSAAVAARAARRERSYFSHRERSALAQFAATRAGAELAFDRAADGGVLASLQFSFGERVVLALSVARSSGGAVTITDMDTWEPVVEAAGVSRALAEVAKMLPGAKQPAPTNSRGRSRRPKISHPERVAH